MMIHADKCRDLGLPEPKSFDTQESYILKAAAQGHIMDTRRCRYIGIHNLHSVVSALHRKGESFELEHKKVLCPFTGTVPPYPVDALYMTEEQQQEYQKRKARKN